MEVAKKSCIILSQFISKIDNNCSVIVLSCNIQLFPKLFIASKLIFMSFEPYISRIDKYLDALHTHNASTLDRPVELGCGNLVCLMCITRYLSRGVRTAMPHIFKGTPLLQAGSQWQSLEASWWSARGAVNCTG